MTDARTAGPAEGMETQDGDQVPAGVVEPPSRVGGTRGAQGRAEAEPSTSFPIVAPDVAVRDEAVTGSPEPKPVLQIVVAEEQLGHRRAHVADGAGAVEGKGATGEVVDVDLTVQLRVRNAADLSRLGIESPAVRADATHRGVVVGAGVGEATQRGNRFGSGGWVIVIEDEDPVVVTCGREDPIHAEGDAAGRAEVFVRLDHEDAVCSVGRSFRFTLRKPRVVHDDEGVQAFGAVGQHPDHGGEISRSLERHEDGMESLRRFPCRSSSNS